MRVTVVMRCPEDHRWRQGGEFIQDDEGRWVPQGQYIVHCPECGRSAVRTTACREGSVVEVVRGARHA